MNISLLNCLAVSFLPSSSLAAPVQDQEGVKCAIDLGILLTQLAVDALEDFNQGKLRQFDALVGDTSCQIRAVFVAKHYQNSKEQYESLRIRAKTANQTLRELRKKAPEVTSSKPLREFLPQLVLEDKEQLPQEAVTLILAHTLFRTRDRSNPAKTNALNLNEIIGEGSSLIKEDDPIVRQAKNALAVRSIDFLKKEITVIGLIPAMATLYKSMFTKGILHDGRPCSPCYFNLRLLLDSLLKDRRIVILKISRPSHRRPGRRRCTTLTFRASKKGTGFKRLCQASKLPDQSAVVFEGTSQSKLGFKAFAKKFKKRGLKTAILANAAAHPQYVGKNKDAPIPHYVKKQADVCMKTILEGVSDRCRQGDHLDEAYQAVAKPAKTVTSVCAPVDPKLLCKTYMQQQRHKQLAEKVKPLFKINHIIPSLVSKELGRLRFASTKVKDDEKEARLK